MLFFHSFSHNDNLGSFWQFLAIFGYFCKIEKAHIGVISWTDTCSVWTPLSIFKKLARWHPDRATRCKKVIQNFYSTVILLAIVNTFLLQIKCIDCIDLKKWSLFQFFMRPGNMNYCVCMKVTIPAAGTQHEHWSLVNKRIFRFRGYVALVSRIFDIEPEGQYCRSDQFE